MLEGNIDELQRLSRLVADMLFLAQADHAPDALQLERIDLAHEARRVADFAGLLADERNVVISIDGEAPVVADRGLVQRAITNLLSNAVRHCHAGTTLQVHARLEGGIAWLDVVNHGEAIASEHLPRLFDRFYRVDRSRARDGGGTGLGLAIVKAIAALHGGSVEAARGPDGMTRFTLRLPSMEAAAPAAKQPSATRRRR
ncbi:ATP-binding protein [Roseateles sp.]|uniref:ATP-binding protein n=1 Tax=Roseateles sp. TaxID=1971397 RepID=UPI00286B5DA2|nr:ATP-binding protein [Roseateles sp.]